MATKQTALSAGAGTGSTVAVAMNTARRSLYIRNYAGSGATMWVSFGKAATAGTAGELEIIPGGEYTFGGPLPPSLGTLPRSTNLPQCPQEAIYVVTSTSTATGCVMEQ